MKNKSGHKGQNSTPSQVERTIKANEPKSGMEAKLNAALGASTEPEKIILPPAQEGTAPEIEGAADGAVVNAEAPKAEDKPSKLGEAKKVRELKAGDEFRYKSSSAKWACTSANEDGSVIEMAKEGGKSWKVTKARELDQFVYLFPKAAVATPEMATEPEA